MEFNYYRYFISGIVEVETVAGIFFLCVSLHSGRKKSIGNRKGWKKLLQNKGGEKACQRVGVFPTKMLVKGIGKDK